MVGKPLEKTKVPKDFQHILWSVDVNDLDIEKHKGYIIHQVLAYGTFAQIRWLFSTYHKKQVIEVFLKRPSKLFYHWRKTSGKPFEKSKAGIWINDSFLCENARDLSFYRRKRNSSSFCSLPVN